MSVLMVIWLSDLLTDLTWNFEDVSNRIISQRSRCTPTRLKNNWKWRTLKRRRNRRPRTCGNAQFPKQQAVRTCGRIMSPLRARFIPEHSAPFGIIMRHTRLLTFAFLIFTKNEVSALQELSLPNNPAPPGPPNVVTVPGWTYRGCYTDPLYDRTFTGENWTGKLTPSRCSTVCGRYRYFALESSNE